MNKLILSSADYQQTLMYFKEIGNLVALYRKDNQQYLVAWAGPGSLDTGDLYVAVAVDEATIAAYLAKSITGHDIQKQASEAFLGSYNDGDLELTQSSFAYLVENEHTLAVNTSFYDECFKTEED